MDISKIRPPTGIVQPAPLHNPASAYSDGFPIALTAKVTLDSGQMEKPNVQGLKNTTPFPIEISEIRFTLSRDDSANDGVIVAGCVGVKASIETPGASIDLTQDFIPLWLLDQSRRLYSGESFVGSDSYSVAAYVWKLSTPIYLQPGEIIVPEFINYGLVPVSIDIGVTYCGRVLVGHPTPQYRVLPYVSMWQSKGFDLSFVTAAYPQLTTDEDESPENRLYNPTDSQISVRLFTGRTLNVIDPAVGNTIFSDDVQPMIDMFCGVNMRTSKGYEITPGQDYVPFHLMFSSDTRAFPGGIVLEPGDYVMAKIQMAQGNLVPYNNAGTNLWPTIQTPTTIQIGMVGERSVAL